MGEDELRIAGVRRFDLSSHTDARGSLTELYRRSGVAGGREAVQANLSRSVAGVLRGLHRHRRQADYWCVLTGIGHVRLVDLREGSPTRLETASIRIDADERRVGLAIPPGVAHGFFAETELLLLYLVDGEFTGDDEFGLAWDDPALGLPWPSASPILSERHLANPSLDDVLGDPPTFAGPAG